MPGWRYKSYCTSAGRNEVRDWYQSLTPALRAAVMARLLYLRQMPRQSWQRPYFALLRGDGAGLGEVRLKLNNVQHRLIGYFGPDQGDFSILLVALEKGGKFIPRDTCAIAQRRKLDTQSNPLLLELWPNEP